MYNLRVCLTGAAAFRINIVASTGLLTIAIHFAKLVCDSGSNGHVFGFHATEFARAPTEIKANQIIHLKWPHGHTKAENCIVNLIGRRPLENNFACLSGIAREHSIANKARSIAGQNSDFVQCSP